MSSASLALRRGFFAIAISLVIALLLRSFPETLGSAYWFCYKKFKLLHDGFHQQSFIDWTDVLVILLVALIVRFGVLISRERSWKKGLSRVLTGLFWGMTWFLWSWGFFYTQPTFAERLQLEVSSQLPTFQSQVVKCIELQDQASAFHFEEGQCSKEDLKAINNCINEFFDAVYPEYKGPGHIKLVQGNGFMRKMGASGIYLPWSGLGHVDATYT
ncbi:MAG: DUF3810 family protein, partial [Flavobacteriales bacterium]|nr:DUF3810 family protein [Flavobacteriales bacterium]